MVMSIIHELSKRETYCLGSCPCKEIREEIYEWNITRGGPDLDVVHNTRVLISEASLRFEESIRKVLLVN